ncbi:MAG: hypothetical protein JWP79_1798 [Polaromonas sp.]|jgi:hypothetical protein|nr:hypothetical protein [Polaromonas sp.]
MKHQLCAIAFTGTLAMIPVGTALAQASADINQTGQDHTAYAEQVSNAGANIAATLVQSGNGNRAGDPDTGTVSLTAGGILQKENRGNTTAEVRQDGSDNLGMVTQEGVGEKYGRVSQTGVGHTGTIIEQGGTGGGAAITQVGVSNAAAVTLSSSGGVVEVVQSSQDNKAEVTQRSSGRTALRQDGAFNTAILDNQRRVGDLAVEQAGSANFALATSLGSIVQTGTGNSAWLSGTNDLVINPVFYNTTGRINQQGMANNASISQRWSAGNGVASIDQLGNGHTASLTTLGRHGGIVQIRQQGNAHSASVDQASFTASNVYVDQQGTGQKATISQKAFQFGQSRTVQKGGFNVASISNFQTGSGDESSILQDGFRNQALVSQSGDLGIAGDINKATIQQQGSDFQAAIHQIGAANRAAIRQH